ncbi:MAG: hypothetical protein GY913_32425 [Proteobacteria bacterium]|nr:hypothetical protein [Pseudomonadota bacterium]MCP4921628.1 hypothetical protein [Pseudomonadota bacterium]
MIWLLLSCGEADPQGPATAGSPAAVSLEELAEVRQASADIEEPMVRVQALLVELREETRDRDEVLAEVELELERARDADARMQAALDRSEAALDAP